MFRPVCFIFGGCNRCLGLGLFHLFGSIKWSLGLFRIISFFLVFWLVSGDASRGFVLKTQLVGPFDPPSAQVH